MKRFIDIGEQTGDQDLGVKEFAFFDTVTGKFESHSGSMTWATEEEFVDDYEGSEIERYLNIIPEDWE